MAKEKSVFERLDDISANQSEILNAISGVDDQYNDINARMANIEQQLQRTQVSLTNNRFQSSEPPMKTFARKARKSWGWFGNEKEFSRSKKLAMTSSLFVILFCIISTVITALSYGMYSPFSLIENIWGIFALIYLIYAGNSPKKIEVNALTSGTPLRYQRDDVGMVFPIGGEKKIFKAFRIITLIFIAFNIIWVWMFMSDISWLATIFEALFAISIIVAFFLNAYFFAQYSICWLEGNNLVTGQPVSLIKMPGFKEFVLEKDLREKIPWLFE